MSLRYLVGHMARLLIPVPDSDFDTSEVAVPWRLLADAGQVRAA